MATLSPAVADVLCSICIPTFNRADMLAETLTHLQWINGVDPTFEIIVSDNASADNTRSVVEQFAHSLPMMRYVCHNSNVGAEKNLASALRGARGKYAIYLGDEDQLFAENVQNEIAFLESRPDFVASYSPWNMWNVERGDLGNFIKLDKSHEFQHSTALDLFNFLSISKLFPEIAVYRTAALARVLYNPHTVHWPFVWLFRLLEQGGVRFHPTPFYRQRIWAPKPGQIEQLGVVQATSMFDFYRGGLEYALLQVLQSMNISAIPKEARNDALNSINDFMCDRLIYAAQISEGQGNFINAHEFKTRRRLWGHGSNSATAKESEQKTAHLAALQTIVEIFSDSAELKQLILCEVAGAVEVRARLQTIRPALPVVICGREQLQDVAANQKLILTDSEELRRQLLATGCAPGLVLLTAEIRHSFRLSANL